MGVMFEVFVFVICLCAAKGDIFEFANVDSLSGIWSNRNSILNRRQSICSVQNVGDVPIEGVCTSRAECLFSNGVPRGHCGILSTCCTYERTCGRTTNAKVSYFTSDVRGAQYELPCPYHIKLANENICQVRLDFIEFDLAPPVYDLVSSTYKCIDEKLDIDPSRGIPPLCGYNKEQHLYIHVPRSSQQVILYMQTNLSKGTRWNIKVTQLECPGNKVRKHKTAQNSLDFPLLAPQGCLQYFNDFAGTIRSFGLRDSATASYRYAADQHYSICFQRRTNICGLSLTIRLLQLTTDVGGMCQDYLLIPQLNDNAPYGICQEIVNNVFTSTPPGPLHIDFHSYSNPVQNDLQLWGFEIDYKLLHCV